MTVRTEAVVAPRPGVRAALRRSRALRVAVIVWILLIGLLLLLDDTALQVPGWFARGIVVLLLPAVALFALAALPLLPFAPTRRAGIAIGAALATLVALLWALVIAAGAWLGGSPYAAIPFLWADSTAGFARRHPHLTVSTLATVDPSVSDAAGRVVELDPFDVPRASFAFEDCAMPPLADRLGGLPPPPAPLVCRFRYRIARDGHERLVYVYERRRANRADNQMLPDDADLPYEDWARARGAKVDWHRGGSSRRFESTMSMRAGGQTWQVRMLSTDFRHRLLIAEGGGPLNLPWPPDDRAPPDRAASAPP